MSDWNNDPRYDRNNAGGGMNDHTPQEETSASSDSSPANANGAYTGWSSTPSSETGTGPASNGYSWQSNNTNGNTNQNNTNSYQSFPSSQGYQPQSHYDPYGWQDSNGYTPAPRGPGGQKPPKSRKGLMVGIIAGVGALCAVTIVTLSVLLAMSVSDNEPPASSGSGSSGGSTPTTSSSQTVNENAPSLAIDGDEAEGALTTREIVQKNLDSTVVISMYSGSSGNLYGFGDSQLTQVGTASGIVMSADGYIITNWHCVINEDTGKAYDRVDVTTHDGTVYEGAEIVGADEYTDLAVIKVGAANLTVATFGDSTALQLGDKVVTIGNAGGLEYSVTQGIVSGLNREVYEDSDYSIKCLQVDAAINPGNSGGPLLNNQGQVVGINSAKIVQSGYENLGFSIPISEAKTVIDDLVKYGYVKGRVMLGITGENITQTGYEGFMIRSINSDSVLSGTRAQVGDIITAIDGVRVTTQKELRSELTQHAVGDQITLTLMRIDSRTRQTTEFDITVTLAESKG